MASIALKFHAPLDQEESLSGFMIMHAEIQGIEEQAGDMIYFVAPEEFSEEFEREIEAFAESNDIEYLGHERIEQRDWNAEWEQSITPQRVTEDLVISPSWRMEEAKPLGAKYVVTIDPKMSFGTGHHETTRLCLRAIESLDLKGKRVLDLGTGTGVLAIYVLMRGASSALGVDTDEWSIQNAIENRALNGLAPEQLEIRQGTLELVVAGNERFDVILANIHRNVLVELAPRLREHLVAGGTLVLSGLLVYDVEEVQEAYATAGFQFVRRSDESEWACLMFQS